MDLRIHYKDSSKLSDVVYVGKDTKELDNVVILRNKGKNERTAKVSSIDVVNSMIFAFRRLKNTLPTSIEEITISNFNSVNNRMTRVVVKKDDVEFSGFDNCDVIVMHTSSFDEFLPVTKYAKRSTKTIKKNEDGTTEEVYGNNITYSKLIVAMESVCRAYYPDYTIDVKDRKLAVKYKGTLLDSIEDIKNDEVYTLFSFVQVLLDRTKKFTNIIFADGDSMSLSMLSSLQFILSALLGKNYTLVVYNMDSTKEKGFIKKCKKAQVIEIPDHKAMVKYSK